MPTGVYVRMSLEERWARYVSPEPMSGCWLWDGWRDHGGYGQCSRGRRHVAAHRLAYELFVGPVPGGLYVLHRCDVRCCVNPAHLFLGTSQDNMADMWAKRRGAIGERQGSAKLTAPAVHAIRSQAAEGVRQRDLADLYGVSSSAIGNVVHGKAWAHVAHQPRALRVCECCARQFMPQRYIAKQRFCTRKCKDSQWRKGMAQSR